MPRHKLLPISLDDLQLEFNEIGKMIKEIATLHRPRVNKRIWIGHLITHRIGRRYVPTLKTTLKWIDQCYYSYVYYRDTAVRRILAANGWKEPIGRRINYDTPAFPFTLTALLNDKQRY